MAKRTRAPHRMWTKSDISSVMKLWDTHTVDEMAVKLNANRAQIQRIARLLRDAGAKLPKKHKNGYLTNLINEVVKENK